MHTSIVGGWLGSPPIPNHASDVREPGEKEPSGWVGSCFSQVPADLIKYLLSLFKQDFQAVFPLLTTCQYSYVVLTREWVLQNKEWVAQKVLKASDWMFDRAITCIPERSAFQPVWAELLKRRLLAEMIDADPLRGGKRCQAIMGNHDLAAIVRHIPALEELTLEETALWCTDAGLRAIAEHCPHLKILSVRCDSAGSWGVHAIAQRCIRLEVLELSDANYLSDVALKAIAKLGTHLKRLGLAQHVCGDACVPPACPRIGCTFDHSRCDLYGRSEEMVSDVLLAHTSDLLGRSTEVMCNAFAARGWSKTASAIEEVRRRMNEFTLWSGRRMTDSGLRMVMEQCIALVHLGIAGGQWTDAGLAAIAEHGVQLEELDLRECRSITDAGVKNILMNGGKRLTHLHLANCTQLTDNVLFCLAVREKSLKQLDISGCEKMTCWGLESLLKEHPELEVLRIGRCSWLNDRALQVIAKHGRELRKLDLSGSTGMSKEALEMLIKGCTHLGELDLGDCTWLTNEMLESIGAYGNGLKTLCLRNSNALTGGVYFEKLVAGCTELESLDLDRCSWVRHAELGFISWCSKKLRKLSLARCSNVDESDFIDFIGCYAELEELTLDGMNQLGKDALKAIAEHGTKLQRLSLLWDDVNIGRKTGVMSLLELCVGLREFRRKGHENKGHGKHGPEE